MIYGLFVFGWVRAFSFPTLHADAKPDACKTSNLTDPTKELGLSWSSWLLRFNDLSTYKVQHIKYIMFRISLCMSLFCQGINLLARDNIFLFPQVIYLLAISLEISVFR